MNKSESIKQLVGALAKAQSEFPAIPKDKTVQVRTKTGGTYTFAYAPLDTIMEKIKPTLKANGLAFMQSLSGESLSTTLIHSSGEWWTSDPMPIRVVDQGPQALGSAITYARRYALTAMLGLITEDDDDGNAAEGNDSKPAHKPHTNVATEVWNTMSPDVQAELDGKAQAVVHEIEFNGGLKAMELLNSFGLDADHKVAIWSRFNSKERAAMEPHKRKKANG